jgi:predicted metal-dependent peptidase
VTVVVVVDTSGSVGQSEVNAALAKVKGVIRAAGIGAKCLVVVACDAAVGATSRVRRVEDVQLVGGGGGDMRVGIAAAEASRPQPDVIVVFSATATRHGPIGQRGLGLWWPSSARAQLPLTCRTGQGPCGSQASWVHFHQRGRIPRRCGLCRGPN